jgi:hypothetical protein
MVVVEVVPVELYTATGIVITSATTSATITAGSVTFAGTPGILATSGDTPANSTKYMIRLLKSPP